MALAINDKQNTDAPSALYPQGNIRDNDGTGNGTPVNKQVYADFHQFFARLLVEADISPNHAPENAYDGFQYIDALKNISGDKNIAYTASGLTFPGSGSGGPTTPASAGANLGYKKTVRNSLRLIGIISTLGNSGSFSVNLMRLPAGYRPAIEQTVLCAVNQIAGSNFAVTMKIQTDGNMIMEDTAGTSLSGGLLSVHLDGIEIDL